MSASVPPLTRVESDGRCAAPRSVPHKSARDGRLPVVQAKPADYTAISHFLTAVFQRPNREEFRLSLEDPFHEPHDRLLIKSGSQIVAHAHMTRRVMQFGSLQLPVSGLSSVGISPEFRGHGYGRRLLQAAEDQMTEDGALVGLLWTRIPHFFRNTGWALCCRHCRSGATARTLLAGLESLGLDRRKGRLNIRPWRRMELGALMRIYGQNLPGGFGPFERTEAYWRWLISRKAFDRIYVALDGPDLLELEECRAPIVGYAVTKGQKIIELFTAPGNRRAGAELLARACGDAIERDHHRVTLHAPTGSRIDRLFRKAGGQRAACQKCGCGVLMTRILDPVKLLSAMAPELQRRSDAAGLPDAISLGLVVDGRKYRLALDRKGVKVGRQNIGRSYLTLNVADFTRLVLGQLDWDNAVADGRVTASTGLALKTAQALFPRVPLWRPPLDEISA